VICIEKDFSCYTLNLNTYRPTKNSRGQGKLSNEIINEIKNYLKKYNSFGDDDSKMTLHQKKNFILWENVIEIRNKILEEKSNIFDVLLICLYSFMPPRELEYYKMYYIDEHNTDKFVEDKEKNYCIYDGDKIYFIMNTFRLEYLIGCAKYNICDNLKDIVLEYVKKKKIKNNELLLNITQESQLDIKIKKIFSNYIDDKEISIDILRASYSTFITLNIRKVSLGEWKKNAYLMGYTHEAFHGASVHLDIKNKYLCDFFEKEMAGIVGIKICKEDDKNEFYHRIHYAD